MSIASLIRDMAAAGATPEAIAVAVAAIEAVSAADAARRSKQAERKRKSRHKNNGVAAVPAAEDGPPDPTAGTEGDVTVTGQSQDSHGHVPPMSQKDPPPTKEGPHTPKKTTPSLTHSSRGAELPSDWQPNAKHFAKAAEWGLGPDFVEGCAEAMRDWVAAEAHRSVTRKADWDRTFFGFMRRDRPKAKIFRLPRSGPTMAEIATMDQSLRQPHDAGYQHHQTGRSPGSAKQDHFGFVGCFPFEGDDDGSGKVIDLKRAGANGV